VREWLTHQRARFGRSALLQHVFNAGLAATRNQAFATASTPYVFVLDADNLLYPRCLQTCLGTAARTGAAAVYTALEVFGESSGVMGTDDWDPDVLLRTNYIDAMALVRRCSWSAVGGYRRMPVSGWEDHDFWLKFAEMGLDLARVPEILCRYRVRSSSMLRQMTNQPESLKALHADLRLHHPSVMLEGEPRPPAGPR
jgi:glycosyltransferase involved in cell wall biosynthesis